MGSFFLRIYSFTKVLTTLAIFVCFIGLGGIILFSYLTSSKTDSGLPNEFVLRLNLEQVVEESSNDSPFRYLGKGHPIALRTFIESLERARKDPRILGLVIRASDLDLNLAHAEEMRACLERFKKAGKYVSFYTDSFGERSDAGSLYYLATAASEVWLQPSGNLTLIGFSHELPFIKKFMDLVGVKAEIGQRYEFKSAPDMFLREEIPAHQRESEERLLNVLQTQIDQSSAQTLSLNPAIFSNIRNFRPLSAQEAFDQKLVTHLGYWSDCVRSIRGVEVTLPWVKFTDYIETLEPIESQGKKIALIVIDGEIERGRTPSFDTRGSAIGGDTVAKAIRQAVEDVEVAAILMRIDSPGGSYIASDTMWYEVMQARKMGKPVIASFGTVAASGGYFVGMAADHIISNAATITGSIGVYSGKYIAEDLIQKIGVNFANVGNAENAGMMSPFKKFTPQQWAILNHELDLVYKDFITKFQQNRNIPEIAVDKLARGRVFAGSEALSLGLVDQIGGYYDAVVEAKRRANIPLQEPAAIQVFPRPKTITERVMEYFEDIDDIAQFIKTTRDMILDTKRSVQGARNRVQYSTERNFVK